eukprot:COSAG01_NODE_8755_length_2671_cov_267.949067_3_plen_77_part_00
MVAAACELDKAPLPFPPPSPPPPPRRVVDHSCRSDYGNSENSIIAKNSSLGAGTMEAICASVAPNTADLLLLCCCC